MSLQAVEEVNLHRQKLMAISREASRERSLGQRSRARSPSCANQQPVRAVTNPRRAKGDRPRPLLGARSLTDPELDVTIMTLSREGDNMMPTEFDSEGVGERTAAARSEAEWQELPGRGTLARVTSTSTMHRGSQSHTAHL